MHRKFYYQIPRLLRGVVTLEWPSFAGLRPDRCRTSWYRFTGRRPNRRVTWTSCRNFTNQLTRSSCGSMTSRILWQLPTEALKGHARVLFIHLIVITRKQSSCYNKITTCYDKKLSCYNGIRDPGIAIPDPEFRISLKWIANSIYTKLNGLSILWRGCYQK